MNENLLVLAGKKTHVSIHEFLSVLADTKPVEILQVGDGAYTLAYVMYANDGEADVAAIAKATISVACWVRHWDVPSEYNAMQAASAIIETGNDGFLFIFDEQDALKHERACQVMGHLATLRQVHLTEP